MIPESVQASMPLTTAASLKPPPTTEYKTVNIDASSWITTIREQQVASRTIVSVFAITFTFLLGAAVVALATAPQADVNFENLKDRISGANCLRVARRADYTVVFLNLGSPVQRLELLLELDRVVDADGENLQIFSERMHKSLTMKCQPLNPARDSEQECRDITMLAVNNSNTQRSGQTKFTFQNDRVEASRGNPAYTARLDGVFRLITGNTYWLTTTNLCFAPLEPESAASKEALPFLIDGGGLMSVQGSDLAEYSQTRDFTISKAAVAECNVSVKYARLFPTSASNEQNTWLSLSDRFLYQYGSEILDKRRRVVELGNDCAALQPELAHVLNMYSSDCGLALQPCQTEPALTFRRLATSRMRFDIDLDGVGLLRTEKTDALLRVPSLVSHAESLNFALGRLFVLLLTAAVVFLRGSQNAASSRFMLQHTIDVIRCRKQFSNVHNPLILSSKHDRQEVATDAIISVTALVARIIVLSVSYTSLIADNNLTTVVLEFTGTIVSFLHLVLRYSLDWNLNKEAPLTKLGGPMSVVDSTSAVLLLFSDAPLLASDASKFASIGRMLISVLASIAVFTRCTFSSAMVSVMAVSATNGTRKDLTTHKAILSISVALWAIQATTSAGNVALLFVRPAAIAMARSTLGNTEVLQYAIFFGLVCSALPTFTKVALRVAEAECKNNKNL